MATKVGEGYIEIEPRIDNERFMRESRGVADRSARLFSDTYNRRITSGLVAQRAIFEREGRIAGNNFITSFDRTFRDGLSKSLGGFDVNRHVKNRRVEVEVDVDHDRFRRVLGRMSSDWNRFSGEVVQSARLLGSSFNLSPLRLALLGIIALTPQLLLLIGSLAKASAATLALTPGLFGLVGAAAAAFIGFSDVAGAMHQHSLIMGRLQKGTISAAEAQEEWNLQLAGLEPIAVKLVDQLMTWQAIIGKIRESIQSNAFPGFIQFLKDSQVLLPTIQTFMNEVAHAAGRLASDFAEIVKTPLFQQEFQLIMNTNGAVIRDLTHAVRDLFMAFFSTAAAATGQFGRFAYWIRESAARFRAFIEAKRITGELAKFINDAGDRAAQWGRIIRDFAIGIFNVFRAASGQTQTFTDRIEDLAAKFRAWTESSAGIEKIRRFFDFMMNLDWSRIFAGVVVVTALSVAFKSLSGALGVANLIFGFLAGGPIGIVIGLIFLLAGGFVLLAASIATLTPNFNDLVDAFKKDLAPELEKIGKIFRETVMPMLRKAAEHVIPILKDAFEDFGNTLRDNEPAIRLIALSIGAFLGGAIIFLAHAFRATLVAIGLFLKIVTFLGSVVSGVINFFKMLGSWIGTNVPKFFSDAARVISETWNKIIDGIKTGWSAFLGFWKGIGAIISTTWRAIWSGVLSFLKEVWANIIGFFSGIGRFFFNIFNSIWQTISGIWNSLWDGVSTKVTTVWESIRAYLAQLWIVQFFISIGKIINEIWSKMWNAISGVAVAAWNAIWGFITTIFSAIAGFIGAVLGGIFAVWSATWNAVSSFFSGVWNAIWGFLQAVFHAIRGFIGMMLIGIQATWNTVWGAISGFFSAIWNGIWGFLQAIFHAIRGFIGMMLAGIRGTWESVWNAISGFFQRIWDALRGIVDFAINWVSNKISEVLGKIGGGWTSFWNGIRNGLTRVWDGIRQGVANGLNAVINIINGGIKKVNDMLGKLGISNKLPTIGHVSSGVTAQPIAGQGNRSKLARGGYFRGDGSVRGPGSSTSDSINANLSDGEYVINAKSTKKFFPVIEAINHDTLPKNFSTGGPVVPSYRDGGLHRQMFAWIKQRVPGVRATSTYRAGDPGYHGRGQAVDMVFSDGSERRGGGMAKRAFDLIKGAFFRNIAELIWDFAKGNAVWNGKNHFFTGGSAGPGTHNDHIHWAMRSMAGGGLGFFEWLFKPWSEVLSKLVQPALNALTKGMPNNGIGWIGRAMGKGLGDRLVGWIKGLWEKKKEEFESSMQIGDGSRGADPRLTSWIIQALQFAGKPMSWAGPLTTLVMRESGGNPRAQNNWDSNAARGTPSKGLAQVIGPTFAAHRDKRLPNDPFHPIANLVAALNYITRRYGSIFNVQQANASLPPKGYDNGGPWMPGQLGINTSGKPEMVLNHAQANALERRIGESGDVYVTVKLGDEVILDKVAGQINKNNYEIAQSLRRGRGIGY